MVAAPSYAAFSALRFHCALPLVTLHGRRCFTRAPCDSIMRSRATCLLFVLGTLGAGVACADDDPADDGRTPAEARWADRIEAPRLTRTDVQSEPLRSLPGYRSELNELSYRWWLSSGRADVGLGLGAVSYGLRPVGGSVGLAGDESSKVLATGTVLTLGMRYRTSAHSTLFADAAGVHGLGLEGGGAIVGKVGVDFKLAQSRWNIAYGGLGLRLNGEVIEDPNIPIAVQSGDILQRGKRRFVRLRIP